MRRISHSARQRMVKRRKTGLWLIFITALSLFFLQRADQALRPLTVQVLQYQCRALAARTIQGACNSILEENHTLYNDL